MMGFYADPYKIPSVVYSQPVCGAANTTRAAVEHIGIDHRKET